MADLDDITGWYEEFYILLNSGEINIWKRRKAAADNSFSIPMPISLARQYVSLLLQNSEILDTVRAHNLACSKHPNMTLDFESTGEIPDDVSLLFERKETFDRWFAYMVDYSPGQVSAPCSLLAKIAIGIQENRYKSFDDEEVLSLLREQKHPGFRMIEEI